MSDAKAAAGNSARLLELHRLMARIRAFEEAAAAAHGAGEIPGPLHVSIGQEAVAAGVCLNLRRDDRITSTHRGHGHALAKGAGVAGMMAELHGRAGGHCGGKGGSMHIADFGAGMLGANGVVAGGIPIAVGAAQGLRLLGSDAVVACFFGDGAVNRGPFLEGLNWAALTGCPCCSCARTTASPPSPAPEHHRRAGRPGAGGGAGGARRNRDGNDAAAVDAAARALGAGGPGGAGPRLLHARTTRMSGHTSTDAAAWRTAEEVAALRARDPITALEAALLLQGVAAEALAAARTEAEAEMRDAREAARAAPWPDPEAAWADVQDTGAEGAA
jgi:pyruvate dehydrogenase E1 component alpha subunit